MAPSSGNSRASSHPSPILKDQAAGRKVIEEIAMARAARLEDSAI
jgi:hypothetical protein